MKNIVCFIFLVVVFGGRVPISVPEKDLVASQVFDYPFAEVCSAIRSKIAFLPWKTDEIPGVSCEFSFSSCNPPGPNGLWNRRVVPILVRYGYKNPTRVSFWSGRVLITRLSRGETKVSFYKSISNPMEENTTADTYMRRLAVELREKR